MPNPCVKCGSDERYSTGHCKACARRRALNNYRANPGKYRALQKNWRTINADKKLAADLEWQRANPEKVAVRVKKWRAKNPEKRLQIDRAYYAADPGAHVAKTARHTAAKLRATPAWASEFFISEAYRLAKLREKVCGGKWHVDHIVPLQSPIVCGLHVESNLRVIPARVNIVKGNRHWPDMP